MTKNLSIALSLLLVATGCDNSTDVDYGPCKFAPSESKFRTFPRPLCGECFFNIEFRGQEYSFAGNQLDFGSGGSDHSPGKKIVFRQIENVFFFFYLVSPPSDEALTKSINARTPLLQLDTLSKLIDYPPAVSASFGIFNYCHDAYQSVTDDITVSFHQVTSVESIESYYVGSIDGSVEEYQKHVYYCYGKVHTIFVIDDNAEPVTANYKLIAEIYERL